MIKHKQITSILLGIVALSISLLFMGCKGSLKPATPNPFTGNSAIPDTPNADDDTNPGDKGLLGDTVTIMILPIANGYEYAQAGDVFTDTMASVLDTFSNIVVKPLPIRELQGTSYYGVFSPKYCPPIIQKAKTDYLVLSSYTSAYVRPNDKTFAWGYHIKLLRTDTLKVVADIEQSGFDDYEALVNDLLRNLHRFHEAI